MKKILFMFILPLLLQSCLFEEENNFDNTATERAQQTKDAAAAALKNNANGWVLHYFANLEYGGYNYLISFDGQQATILSELADSDYKDSCLYQVKTEQGVILTFDTYSELLHFFRDPMESGLDGDYEFIVTKVEPGEISLQGKTSLHKLRLFSVPAEYTKESYLDAVQTMASNGRIGAYELFYDGKLVDTVTGTQRGRYLTYSYKEAVTINDTLTTVASIPLIYTPDGFVVYHDKTANVKRNVRPAKPSSELVDFVFDADKEYTEFTYDAANKKFVSKDGKIEFVKLALADLNIRIIDFMKTTSFDYMPSDGSACAAFNPMWTTAANGLASAYGSQGVAFSDITVGYDYIFGSDVTMITFWCGRYNTMYGLNVQPVAGTTDQISMSAIVRSDYLNWGPFGPYLTPILNFFVNNSPWLIEPYDIEFPEKIKLINVSDPEIWIFLYLE
ncbi:MAG: DUF4302 domain-containing protein [Prevotellaceae bacterium]|jgi:hypothetical protein|nr:DUF4302 domain-containing protein [Prevotellaceae bacterium]